ncbi:hypothetical protein AJ80_07974 [Polytolypa hystricis UAMH7299]|uniref:MARVEL domain-containing protein n=1 Tax=Polytolypa hystricis (strain UAMH7299) TaxID=1447883 RepID=A0A2B7XF60_POLH7|nr:hypothetical protein AJ80_07974 [Polytolypa hystricis UAMH7299]
MTRAPANKFIRLTNLIIRIIQFCASALILGIFSYFLAVLADHDMEIGRWMKAVEGLSGAATLYTLLASIFTLWLGGIRFFAALAMFLDLCFVAVFIALAVMTRDGAHSCTGFVNTPLGSGDSDNHAPGYGKGGFGTGAGQNLTFMPNLGFACRLQKGTFAVSIIGIFLFIASLYPQLLYARQHKRAQRYGPSPANNYTSGPAPKSRWRFGRKETPAQDYPGVGTPVAPIPLRSSSEMATGAGEKPSRYARFFTRSKKAEATASDDESKLTGGPAEGSGNGKATGVGSPYGYNYTTPGYGYGNTTGMGAADGAADTTGQGSTPYTGYAQYGYGQSGVDAGVLSHGYGSSTADAYRPNGGNF